jgi:hypothetical protein
MDKIELRYMEAKKRQVQKEQFKERKAEKAKEKARQEALEQTNWSKLSVVSAKPPTHTSFENFAFPSASLSSSLTTLSRQYCKFLALHLQLPSTATNCCPCRPR